MKIGTFGDGWDGCERQLMEVHDGDDRCGCIRSALAAALDDDAPDEAWRILSRCVDEQHVGWRDGCAVRGL